MLLSNNARSIQLDQKVLEYKRKILDLKLAKNQNGEKLLISWFAGCVPAENPRFAFAAICEGNPGQEITGSNKSAPMVGEFFNSLYELKKERGELEDYSKTAVASSFKLPDDEDSEQIVDELPSEGSNTLRRLLNPFRKKR